jgi:hypothetical protein
MPTIRRSRRLFTKILFLAVTAGCLAGVESRLPTRQTKGFPPAVSEEGLPRVTRPSAPTTARIQEAYGRGPLAFEANRGQVDPQVDFLVRGAGYSLFLTPSEAVLALAGPAPRESATATTGPVSASRAARRGDRRSTVLRLKLVGANGRAHVTSSQDLPTKVNYLLGNDPARWRTDIPTHAKVTYEDVYPGVDLVYYGTQQQLEYDFIIHPGSSPTAIRLRFDGADRIEVDGHGELVVQTAGGEVRQHKPRIYQEVDGHRREIAGGYILHQPSQVAFEIGEYDARRPLVIDPTLAYSTYLRAVFGEGHGIAVDAAGSAYVTGWTYPGDFPTTPGAFDTTANGDLDVFVTKFNANGSALLYSTYLGGSAEDFGWGIAVDAAGSAYVTGATQSADFPTTSGAFDTTLNGGYDVFVTKLNASGSAPLYSTYVGGSRGDEGRGIAVDAVGSAYVTGYTGVDFPTTPGAFDTTANGDGEVFVTKLDANGSTLLYSTYLGGSSDELGYSIAVDTAGNAYVTGLTASDDFATTPGAFDTTFHGGYWDGFVTKLNATGSAPLYSTYLGGSRNDGGGGIAVDATGSAYVTGATESADFPTTSGAFDTTLNGYWDGFVTKFNATGSAPLYSTYLGGSFQDSGDGIAVDAAGNAYVTGSTGSADFPTTPGAFDTTLDGGYDVFVTKLNASGSAPLYSTYLGGRNEDFGHSIAVDAAGSAYVTGSTSSADFPTTPGAFDTTFDFGGDVFVTKIAGAAVEPPATLTLTPAAATNPVDSQHCVTATVEDAAGNPVPGVTVRFTVTGAVNTSASATTDDNGEAVFCYQGPPLPGADAVSAYADTDGDNMQDPGEPSGTATKTWVLPVSTPLCTIMNGGWIIAATGDRVSFGGNAESNDRSDAQGQEEYQDHGPVEPVNMHSINVLAIVCDGTMQASIFGQGTVNGTGSVFYRIRVQDLAEPGIGHDTYGLLLQNGYNSGEQILKGGNIQIRRE